MFYILIPVTGFTCHLKSNLTKYSEFTDLHFHVTLYSNYWLVCLLSGSCAQLCPNRFPFQISDKQNLSCSCLVFLLRRGPSMAKCLRKGLWTVQRLSQWHCSSLRCFCEAFSLYHFLRNTSFMDCSVWCSCSTLSLKLNILHWIMIIIASLSSSISCWQYLSGNVDCTVPTYWFIFGPFTNLPFGIDKPSILTSKP